MSSSKVQRKITDFFSKRPLNNVISQNGKNGESEYKDQKINGVENGKFLIQKKYSFKKNIKKKTKKMSKRSMKNHPLK